MSVGQSINDGIEISLSKLAYDELGRVSQKSLGNGLEIQNYDYNIRGQLTGINSDYVNSECSPQGTTSTFGCILNYDFGFTNPRFDGSISGIKWRGASHTTPLRSYGYDYDDKGQLSSAEFRELSDENGHQNTCGFISSTLTWNKIHTDFTAKDIQYDVNGNMSHMLQRGNSSSGPVDVDVLDYSYKEWSNKLSYVRDGGVVDASLPDFKDVSVYCSGTTPSLDPVTGVAIVCLDDDYIYDADGNLFKDANKKILNIKYNENDQPFFVAFENGSSIHNIYDAAGRLLVKKINNTETGIVTVYTYSGPFVYKDGVLQYALHDEGRARYDATSNLFTYDYFVKDHLGNVRTVVTGNRQNTPIDPLGNVDDNVDVVVRGPMYRSYYAGHEIDDAGNENAIFSNIELVRDSKPETQDKKDVSCARLNGDSDDRRIGTSLMVKVMAGDIFNADVQSFCDDTSTVDYHSSRDMMSSLLTSLSVSDAFSNALSESGNVLDLKQIVNNTDYDAYDLLISQNTNPDIPRAYLNYLFFDEQMVFKPELSGVVQVGKVGGQWQQVGTDKITISANGYLNVYISNATGKDVYFDWLHVNIYHGTLLQENHYYPFGLTLNMGESASPIKNKFKYQGKEMQEELGFDMYDFTARQYDPQIGRFWGVDPAGQFPSGYTGMGNDPGNMIDPTGCYAHGASGGTSNSTLQGQQIGVRGSESDLKDEYQTSSDKGREELEFEMKQDQDDEQKHKTTTDAGHGAAGDSGATSKDTKEKESDYALKIETATNFWLKMFGIDNTRTRTDDVKGKDKFQFRIDAANNSGSEIFVSFHLNGGTTSENVYVVYQQDKANETESIALAKSLASTISSVMNVPSNAVAQVKGRTRYEHLAVLNNFNGKAGVLIEFGSVQNSTNTTYINNNASAIGFHVAVGMYQYLNNGKLPYLHIFGY